MRVEAANCVRRVGLEGDLPLFDILFYPKECGGLRYGS